MNTRNLVPAQQYFLNPKGLDQIKMNKIAKIFLTPNIVMLLRTVALLLVLILIYLIIKDWENNKILIAALGVLISALLASYSMVLNIETTLAIKERENSNLIRYVFFKFCGIKGQLEALKIITNLEEKTTRDIIHCFESIDDIDNMLNELKTKDVISILHNDVLTGLHFLFLYSNSLRIGAKTMRNHIESASSVSQSVTKDFNLISFEPSEQIEQVNHILNYLRTAYEKEFPGKGGIEECSGQVKLDSKI